jgi:hypothetical protein
MGRVNKKLLIWISSLSFLIFLSILKIASSTRETSSSSFLREQIYSSKEDKESSRNGSLSGNQPDKDLFLVKMNLLKRMEHSKSQNVGNPVRNIFKKYPYGSVQQASEKNETSLKEKEEIKGKGKNEPDATLPPINFKLIGIIAMPKSRQLEEGLINYAILSGNGVLIVKKGDVLNGRYEILDVSSESVEIRDMELNRTETLSLEKEP